MALGSNEGWRVHQSAPLRRPSGSLARIEASARTPGNFVDPMDYLDDPSLAKDLANAMKMPNIRKGIEEIQAQRTNPELQALVMRWEGFPVTTIEQWVMKRHDYKQGGYRLFPQNDMERKLFEEEIALLRKEQEKKQDLQRAAQRQREEAERRARLEQAQAMDGIYQRMANGANRPQEMKAINPNLIVDRAQAYAEAPDVKALIAKIETGLSGGNFHFSITQKETDMLRAAYLANQLPEKTAAYQYAKFILMRSPGQAHKDIPRTREFPQIHQPLPRTREFSATVAPPPKTGLWNKISGLFT